MKGQKIYFASDVHLGFPGLKESLEREKLFVKWLDGIKNDAAMLFLVGDIFDFWFEYKRAIPKGFTRFLGKLSELCDSGIPVYFFTGNHDMWIFSYLPEETGITVVRKPMIKEINGKRFYIAHGDGLGTGDKTYKLLKWFFTGKFSQWLFARLHPNFGIKIAHTWSRHSRYSKETPPFSGEEKEKLIQHAKNYLETKNHIDYFIFGHRHIPMEIDLTGDSKLINLGDWVENFTFAVFDGKEVHLKNYISK